MDTDQPGYCDSAEENAAAGHRKADGEMKDVTCSQIQVTRK